jgi:hypothetical protein
MCESKVNLSNYRSAGTKGGRKYKLLLILDLGTRWGLVSVAPLPRFTPWEG